MKSTDSLRTFAIRFAMHGIVSAVRIIDSRPDLNYHAYTFLHINSDRMFVADFGYGAFLAKATAFSECDNELRL